MWMLLMVEKEKAQFLIGASCYEMSACAAAAAAQKIL
jgi:hypothetical protein